MKKGVYSASLLVFLVLFLVLLGGPSRAAAAEKLSLGSAIKQYSGYYLPILAAQEQGFWKRQGIEVEWRPFRGGAAMHRAFAAKALNIGLSSAASDVQGMARGLPVVIVSELFNGSRQWFIWVRTDSPVRKPKGLRGSIGVTRLGGASHAYSRMIARSLGIEKDVRFVATGGVRSEIASLKSGAIDAAMMSIFPMIRLKLAGQARELIPLADYLPKHWAAQGVVASRGFVKSQPELVGKVVKGLLESTGFIRNNRGWTVEKMKSMSRYSQRAAELIYERLEFTKDGKISRKGLENVRRFLIEYGIISREKAPPVDEIFTRRFTG